MMKFLISLSACALASASLASINLNLNLEYWSVSPGGSTTVTGTITVTPGWDMGGANVEFPSNGVQTLTAALHPDLLTYMGQNTTAPYSGNLFTITALLTDPQGLYDMSDSGIGVNSRAEMIVSAVRASDQAFATDLENYGAVVEGVPEPASLVALAAGGLVLLRRRRKLS